MTLDWHVALRNEGTVLVTGAAGFIGFHLSERLLDQGVAVAGLDNLNTYYDPALKRARLERLSRHPGFRFIEADIAERAALEAAFAAVAPCRVVHLAAQAGVRHSITHPHDYGAANLIGFLNVLECCRNASVAHLLYASSSSVYGGNRRLPFSVHQGADHPVSLYAATKRANEAMAHAYSHLYGIPATGLRFFTVYGPWGRPDMAYWSFADAIAEGRPIELFNHGEMRRDFTYIDDVVEALARLLPCAPAPDAGFDRATPDPATSWAPHRLYNVGNDRTESLAAFVELLEAAIGRTAVRVPRPMPPGDVRETWADVSDLEVAVGWRPSTALADGLPRFIEWWRAWRARR